MLEPGDRAPAFEGQTQGGDKVGLSDYAGQRLALHFYPKDGTPGCTAQACSLREGWDALTSAGVAVLGVLTGQRCVSRQVCS